MQKLSVVVFFVIAVSTLSYKNVSATPVQCQQGYAWNPALRQCVEPVVLQATSHTCQVQCRLGVTFTYPHFTQCGRFYQCVNGHLFDFTCPDDEVFDHRTLQCEEGGVCILNRS